MTVPDVAMAIQTKGLRWRTSMLFWLPQDPDTYPEAFGLSSDFGAAESGRAVCDALAELYGDDDDDTAMESAADVPALDPADQQASAAVNHTGPSQPLCSGLRVALRLC